MVYCLQQNWHRYSGRSPKQYCNTNFNCPVEITSVFSMIYYTVLCRETGSLPNLSSAVVEFRILWDQIYPSTFIRACLVLGGISHGHRAESGVGDGV